MTAPGNPRGGGVTAPAAPAEPTARAEAAPVVRVEGLVKFYRRTHPGERLRTLKSMLVSRGASPHLPREEAIVALEGIDFTVGPGEAFAIIGGNGSGKSTLLKLLAGMLKPTAGRIAVAGRVAALIELGAGFHPEISGRENVYINGAVLGLTRRQIEHRYADIVEFAGLADFMEEPVKNYSSGMYVRLGFAVAIHTDPDVLLVDEVLAVGDEAFAHRCVRRIEEFLAGGKTLLMVSHSLELVAELCDRALWLDRGRQRLLGTPRRVVDAYRQAVAEGEGEAHLAAKRQRESEAEGLRAAGGGAGPSDAQRLRGEQAAGAPGGADADGAGGEVLRWGSRAAELVALRLLAGGGERYHLECGEPATFEIVARAAEPLGDFVFGVAVHTPRGHEVWGTNTDLEGYVPGHFAGEATVRLTCPALRLAPGEYTVDFAVHARDGAPYDYRRRALGFTVTARTGGVGVYFPVHHWSFEGGELRWQAEPAALPGAEPVPVRGAEPAPLQAGAERSRSAPTSGAGDPG